jgi:hypothetical protein
VTSDSRHLADVRLMTCYLAEAEPIEARLDPEGFAHLASCATCAARYDQLAWQVDELRADETEHVDALFSPERLDMQRAQIMRRLEAVGRQAKVLRFPVKSVRRLVPRARLEPARRWIAGAAVAGLIAGLSLGWMMDERLRNVFRGSHPAVHVAQSGEPGHLVAAPGAIQVQDARPSDEAFLSEIDRALMQQRASELEALDDLTPRVREVAAVIR